MTLQNLFEDIETLKKDFSGLSKTSLRIRTETIKALVPYMYFGMFEGEEEKIFDRIKGALGIR